MLNSRARMMTALAALFTLGAAPVWAAETTEQAAADTITIILRGNKNTSCKFLNASLLAN